MEEPRNDWRDTAIYNTKKVEEKLNKLSAKIKVMWDKSGYEAKITNFFKKHLSKKKPQE